MILLLSGIGHVICTSGQEAFHITIDQNPQSGPTDLDIATVLDSFYQGGPWQEPASSFVPQTYDQQSPAPFDLPTMPGNQQCQNLSIPPSRNSDLRDQAVGGLCSSYYLGPFSELTNAQPGGYNQPANPCISYAPDSIGYIGQVDPNIACWDSKVWSPHSISSFGNSVRTTPHSGLTQNADSSRLISYSDPEPPRMVPPSTGSEEQEIVPQKPDNNIGNSTGDRVNNTDRRHVSFRNWHKKHLRDHNSPADKFILADRKVAGNSPGGSNFMAIYEKLGALVSPDANLLVAGEQNLPPGPSIAKKARVSKSDQQLRDSYEVRSIDLIGCIHVFPEFYGFFINSTYNKFLTLLNDYLNELENTDFVRIRNVFVFMKNFGKGRHPHILTPEIKNMCRECLLYCLGKFPKIFTGDCDFYRRYANFFSKAHKSVREQKDSVSALEHLIGVIVFHPGNDMLKCKLIPALNAYNAGNNFTIDSMVEFVREPSFLWVCIENTLVSINQLILALDELQKMTRRKRFICNLSTRRILLEI